MKDEANKRLCKRCNQRTSNDIVCQSCKNELLSHYEASLDWQTAFEIEKAQLTAARYRIEWDDDEEANW